MVAIISSKVDAFIESLDLPKDLATVLLGCDSDCNEFFESFYKRNTYALDDLLDYRDYKISRSNVTFDMFEEWCYTKGMGQTFESTFYQSFSEKDLVLIADKILSDQITLEELFIGFKNNPDKNIMKYVL